MANQLAQETSPYLLQHAENPVQWYPWGEEAVQKSRKEDKPIFLSIGYSACHWCHVMEHESFENSEIADKLNEHFVSIKVDREERPDLDQIYMTAVQMLTGHGGWPMSVFLTPELQPFYGGTYWPPRPARGMPGFDQILDAVYDAWVHRREKANEAAAQITQHIQHFGAPSGEGKPLTSDALHTAEAKLERIFDRQHGGFGSAPKFPRSMDLQMLLRQWNRRPREELFEIVTLTLDKMAQGGIYDHLGGGFARYSVDSQWLVPHFEKMLYDNALLGNAYLDAFQATEVSQYADVVQQTLDYVLEIMTDEQGGFYSTEDADSEGVEGKFYVWTWEEVREALVPELGEAVADRFCLYYDVSERGNFEGQNILNVPKSIEQVAATTGWDPEELEEDLEQARQILLEVRNQRVRPGKDDKILASWNGLMIDTMARAAGVLNEPRYLTAAQKAASFLLQTMRCDNGRLLHSYRHGRARFDAYLDDYTFLINALVTLYEADFDESWLTAALELSDIVLKHFADEANGGFYYTADDHEKLIARNKDFFDSSVPSGNSMAAVGFLRLGKLTGRDDLSRAAERTLQMAGEILQEPLQSSQLLIALDMWCGPIREIVIAGEPEGDETAALLQAVRKSYLPNKVVACRADPSSGTHDLAPLFEGKTAEPQPTLFICRNYTCEAPVTGKDAAIEHWNQVVQQVHGEKGVR